ncbi:MAG: polysaccharide biosynthesis C-terminal domain-containing protein [Planctomycetes bacterium]|nr:polysaccharide biosynthesis C-terminal domain-containing protein [Planctomycetota bacterium]
MSSIGSVTRNVLASWGTHASNLVIGFFLTRYTLDVLGVSTYGSWLLINSIASYSALLYCGLGETISRYVAKYHSEGNWLRINQVVTLVLSIYLGMGAVAFLLACVLCLSAGWWGGWVGDDLIEAQFTILILGVNVAVGMAGSVFGGVLHGLRRFDLERGIGFSFDLVRLVLFLAFLSDRYGLVTIALIYLVVAVGENLAYIVLARRILPTLAVGPRLLNREVFRECGQFSSMVFVSVVASQLINATDTITIGLLLGKEAIVPYYFGLRLTQFAKQPIDKIAHICMPTAGALQGALDTGKRNRFLIKTLGIVLLLVGGAFIGAWFFATDVLSLWVGSKLTVQDLTQSHRILMVLLGAQLIALPCGILRAFLFGSGHVKVPALIYLGEACTNLALSITLCLFWGIEGVAWGTTIPVVVFELCVLVPYALSKLQINLLRILDEAVLPQCVPLLALLAYSFLVSNHPWSHGDWRALFAVSICGAGILGGALWIRRKLDRSGLAAA